MVNKIKLPPQIYHNWFTNTGLQAKKENEILGHILGKFEGKTLDVGCGTGFGYTLLDTDYMGIDTDEDRIRFCRNSYPNGKFLTTSAYDYVKNRTKGKIKYIIALFSLNYMKPSIVSQLLRKQAENKKFLAIHYNKPHKMGSNSTYLGKKEYFNKKHKSNKRRLLENLDRLGFTTIKFMGEDYYFLSYRNFKTPEGDLNGDKT